MPPLMIETTTSPAISTAMIPQRERFTKIGLRVQWGIASRGWLCACSFTAMAMVSFFASAVVLGVGEILIISLCSVREDSKMNL